MIDLEPDTIRTLIVSRSRRGARQQPTGNKRENVIDEPIDIPMEALNRTCPDMRLPVHISQAILTKQQPNQAGAQGFAAGG